MQKVAYKITFLFLLLGTTAAIDLVSVSAQMKPRKPAMISRRDWNARKPVGEGKKHAIRYITIHHTATKQRPDVPVATKMRNLQAFSQRDDKLDTGKFKPRWFDIPYHFYIAVDGRIAEGRKLKYVGDTNTEYDPAGHALLVLEGSFNKEHPSQAQIDSMKKLVAWLVRKYKVPAANIKGHDDYARTGCPGENLKKLLPEMRHLNERNKLSLVHD
ncbi:MAG: peptidoglycan recognition family protein [Pyrinomonadaceae bacterium]